MSGQLKSWGSRSMVFKLERRGRSLRVAVFLLETDAAITNDRLVPFRIFLVLFSSCFILLNRADKLFDFSAHIECEQPTYEQF